MNDQKLRKAAAVFNRHQTAKNLQAVQREASRLQALDPSKAREVVQV